MSTPFPTRLLTIALALLMVPAFAACTDEPEMEEPMVDEPVVEEPMVDDDMPAADVTVDGTISALEGGLTNLAIPAAIENINGWIQQIEAADFEGSEDLVDSLEELREELGDTPIDGDDVGDVLIELGEDTATAGAGNAGLERLAALLVSAGESLGGSPGL